MTVIFYFFDEKLFINSIKNFTVEDWILGTRQRHSQYWQ